jgi:hypothetical protein
MNATNESNATRSSPFTPRRGAYSPSRPPAAEEQTRAKPGPDTTHCGSAAIELRQEAKEALSERIDGGSNGGRQATRIMAHEGLLHSNVAPDEAGGAAPRADIAQPHRMRVGLGVCLSNGG